MNVHYVLIYCGLIIIICGIIIFQDYVMQTKKYQFSIGLYANFDKSAILIVQDHATCPQSTGIYTHENK